MSATSIFAIVAIALVVGVVAAFLVRVAMVLGRVVKSLGSITSGVGNIAERTEPIGPVVRDVNKNLTAVADALDATLAKAARSR